MKVGRNKPCPCGSGNKYKKCCINRAAHSMNTFKQTAIPTDIHQHAQRMLRLHSAREQVRRQQQGHGQPIVSFMDRGYRIVAVKNKLYWSQKWPVFTDFLLSFMKDVFTIEWGKQEQSKKNHPLFRWLEKTQRYKQAHLIKGKITSIPTKGFVACYLRLAYALYLIAHNDAIPPSWLVRLRKPDSFMPAYYETIVGAILAVAGFELSCAETKSSSKPTPEFRIKSKTSDKVYNVEAKRKDSWRALTDDIKNKKFQRELEQFVRSKIYKASKKELENPIYWFELSIPTLDTPEDWQIIANFVTKVIREAESTMTLNGEKIKPAFIAITNHTFLVNEDSPGAHSYAFVQGINIDDFPFGQPMETEKALEAYDKYRDIFWMMDAITIAQDIPTTFDGTPPELLLPNGSYQKTVQIGDMMFAPDENGKDVPVIVEEISTMKDEAWIAVRDQINNKRWLAKFPLTAEESAAATKYGDAVFGKDNAGRKLREDDPFDLYDWLLEANKNITQEQVNRVFSENSSLEPYRGLPLKDARIRIAREYTKWIWAKKLQNSN